MVTERPTSTSPCCGARSAGAPLRSGFLALESGASPWEVWEIGLLTWVSFRWRKLRLLVPDDVFCHPISTGAVGLGGEPRPKVSARDTVGRFFQRYQTNADTRVDH